MAKISKRQDKRFEIKVSVGNGKRISVYGATEAEAKKKALNGDAKAESGL